MHHVIEDERAERDRARQREHFLIAARELPLRAELGVGFVQRRARARDRGVELRQDVGHRSAGGEVRRPGREVVGRVAENRRAPVREIREMRREPAERHRLLVRLPGELRVGHALEQPPCRPHLVIEFSEQRLLESHVVV